MDIPLVWLALAKLFIFIMLIVDKLLDMVSKDLPTKDGAFIKLAEISADFLFQL